MNTTTYTTSQTALADALSNSRLGEIVTITGAAADILAAFRKLKRERKGISGEIEVGTQFKGVKIRPADKTDGKAMARVFKDFTTKYNEKLTRPLFDEAGNALVATDGRMMLISRIPSGFTREEALANGFTGEARFRWDMVAGDRDQSDYTLSCYRDHGEIKRGSAEHGLLRFMGDAAKAYEHESDDDATTHFLKVKIWDNYYNAAFLADLIDGLFRLGAESVKVCEPHGAGPINLFGIGSGVDAKGLLMPIRTFDGFASFAFPAKAA